MCEKEGGPGRSRAHKSNISNTNNVLKANKSIHACFSSCANAVMKLIDGKVVQYCPVYTEPCQDAIKICVVI